MKKAYAFKALKKTRLYEEVAEQIKSAIYQGQMNPGDPLPSEREMSKMFNVGRPTVREALRTLSVMGLVEITHGLKGAMVKECDISQYMEALRKQLSWLAKVDAKTLKELSEVRKYVELGIAHSVATNATEEDFRKLDQLIEKMEACGNETEAYHTIAVEFHRNLALATKNKMFFLVWDMFYDILVKGHRPILRKLFPEGPGKLLKVNKLLLKAMKKRNPSAIDRAIEKHAEAEKFLTTMPDVETPKGSSKSSR